MIPRAQGLGIFHNLCSCGIAKVRSHYVATAKVSSDGCKAHVKNLPEAARQDADFVVIDAADLLLEQGRQRVIAVDEETLTFRGSDLPPNENIGLDRPG